LTFTNKIKGNTPVVQLTNSVKKKLLKQSKLKDDTKAELVETDQNKDKAKVSKAKGVKIDEGKVKTKLNLSKTKSPVSDDQEYYSAVDESLIVTRPRRNCRTRFNNLEGLASSSTSNTPVHDEATSKKVLKGQTIATSNGTKKAGRKPGKVKKVEVDVNSLIVSPTKTEAPEVGEVKKPKKGKKASKVIQEVPISTNLEPKMRTKKEVPSHGILNTIEDELYLTPTAKIVDEVYQTPRPTGEFTEVFDEQYTTPVETVKKPNTRKRRGK